MAELTFPTQADGTPPSAGNPPTSTTFEDAGLKWTWNNTIGVWSSEAGSAASGDGTSVSVGENPPSPASEGDLWWNSSDDNGRLYVYYGSQWVEASPQGSGFSGDYDDLINKPNIPPEFNLDDGSVDNDIIHWAQIGSVQDISTTDLGSTSSGNSYSNIAATGGSGTGLTCNVIRRRVTGEHEVYVAARGQDYEVGDTIFLDLGYNAANSTGSTGINCTIDQVNSTVDGWVARPGSDYYVSSIDDSTNTGVPQFMLGTICGGDTNSHSDAAGESAINYFAIGDKNDVSIAYHGTSVTHQCFLTTPGSGKIDINLNGPYVQGSGVDLQSQFRIKKSSFTFFDWDDAASKNSIVSIDRDSSDFARLTVYKAATTTDFIQFTNNKIHSSTTGGNSALNFLSSNGKYNFRNQADNSNTGQIQAGNVTFRSLSRQTGDENDPANFDAEGNYIGPVEDFVSAIETLKQEKADLLTTVNDLVARVAALEGA